jgi:hypothetical protein
MLSKAVFGHGAWSFYLEQLYNTSKRQPLETCELTDWLAVFIPVTLDQNHHITLAFFG